MNTSHLIKWLFSLAILFIPWQNPVLAEPPLEQTVGLHSSFREDAKDLSPLNANLAEGSGILANIRFHGNYGPLNLNHLCHHTIIRPFGDHTPTSDRDCPQDYTTAILQHIFPSPAGGRLAFAGAKQDFFKMLPLPEIGQLLLLYRQHKGTNNPEAAFQDFKILFNSWINPAPAGKTKGPISWRLNSKDRNELRNLWKKVGVAIEAKQSFPEKSFEETLPDYFARMFAYAATEVDQYPANFVETTLLALTLKRDGVNSVEELKPLLDVFSDYINPVSKSTKVFSEETYNEWRKTAIDENHKITPEAFAQLMQDPEMLIFATLGYDLYEDPYPKMLDTGNTYFFLPSGTMKSFRDCGEASIRGVLSLMAADIATKSFKAEFIRKSFPNTSESLLQFFDGNPKDPTAYKQATYKDIRGELKDRDAWTAVVSNLNTKKGAQVEYHEDGACNIIGGLDSMLAVFERLLKDPEIKRIREEYGEKREFARGRATMLSYILEKFSRDNMRFSWHESGETSFITGNPILTIQVNGKDQFTWKLHRGHFEFAKIGHSGEDVDWRRNTDYPLQQLLAGIKSPQNNSTLIHAVLPFYMGTKARDQLTKEAPSSVLVNFAPEIIYSYPATTTEERLKSADIGMTINPRVMKKLLPTWVNSSDLQDAPLMRKLISLFYKHKEGFHELEFTSNSYPVFKELYDTTVRELFSNQVNKDILKYLTNPYGEALVLDLLEKSSLEKILKIGKIESKNILTLAAKYGHDSLVKWLLDKTEGKLIQGSSLLEAAIENNQVNIIRTLFENKEALEKTTSGISSIFQNAAFKGKADVVKALLDIPDEYFKELRISYEIRMIYRGTVLNTPFANVVRVLLGNPDSRRILLSPYNLRSDDPTRNLYTDIENPSTFTPLHRASTGYYPFQYLNIIDGIPQLVNEITKAFLEDTEAAQILLSQDYIRTLTPDGFTPLHLAISNDFPMNVRTFLENKMAREALFATQNIRESVHQRTPLHLAFYLQKTDIIKILLTDNFARSILLAPQNLQDADGLNPLHYAVSRNKLKDGAILLRDPKLANELLFQRDKEGKIPLFYSWDEQDYNFIQDQMIKYIDFNKDKDVEKFLRAYKDYGGNTFLHLLTKRGSLSSTFYEYLLNPKNPLNSLVLEDKVWVNKEGKSPLDYLKMDFENARNEHTKADILKIYNIVKNAKESYDKKYKSQQQSVAVSTQPTVHQAQRPQGAPQAGVRPQQGVAQAQRPQGVPQVGVRPQPTVQQPQRPQVIPQVGAGVRPQQDMVQPQRRQEAPQVGIRPLQGIPGQRFHIQPQRLPIIAAPPAQRPQMARNNN